MPSCISKSEVNRAFSWAPLNVWFLPPEKRIPCLLCFLAYSSSPTCPASCSIALQESAVCGPKHLAQSAGAHQLLVSDYQSLCGIGAGHMKAVIAAFETQERAEGPGEVIRGHRFHDLAESGKFPFSEDQHMFK